VSQLHPLTPGAASALLGQNASLGRRPTPGAYLSSHHKLHVNQRLYRLEPPNGRHHHVRHIHSELLINLLRGEIRLWLYLSEPLCQRISSDLAKPNNVAAAFSHIKPLLQRTTEAVKAAGLYQHLSSRIHVVSHTPNLDRKTPPWLRHVSHHLGTNIGHWAHLQLAQYFRNNAEEFRRACASQHDGVTLRITMTRVPGMDALVLLSQGKVPKELADGGWPKGVPAFQVTQRAGYAIKRLRD
jgi:hypothetical protein